jgi:hypothetical protein
VEESIDSEDDVQMLRRNGKASFKRDETFQDSEDECNCCNSEMLTF